MTATSQALALEAHGIRKAFGHVEALRGVSLTVQAGELHAIVGDNGAGKSTLIKTLAGVYRPDAGEIRLDGEAHSFRGPGDASAAGIATVYQDLALVDARDVAGNIYLGREFGWGPFIDHRRCRREAEQVVRRLSATIPSMRTLVGTLSGGQRQAVAISRALVQGARLFILDEPTAALGVQESERVLQLVEELKGQGHTIILISHNLEHVLRVADHVTVLRAGCSVGTIAAGESSIDELVHLIVAGVPRQAGAADEERGA